MGFEHQINKLWIHGFVDLCECMEVNSALIDIALSSFTCDPSEVHPKVIAQTRSLLVYVGLDSHFRIGNSLIHLLGSSGSLLEANHVFLHVQTPSVSTWNALVVAHIKQGKGKKAVQLYREMHQTDTRPDKVTMSNLLRACCSFEGLHFGKLLHNQVIENGIQSDIIIGSGIADLYAHFGRFKEALYVLDNLSGRNVVTWGAVIAGFIRNGQERVALELFDKMQKENIKPNDFIFACILKACGSLGLSAHGRRFHEWVTYQHLESNIVVGTTLVDMYMKCGCLEDAERTFNSLPYSNAVTWGAMITGFVQHGCNHAALQHFEKMEQKGIKADKYSYSCILKACGCEGAIREGRFIHNQMIVSGFQSDEAISNALVDMYARSGNLDEAEAIFERLITWNLVSCSAMVAGYVQHGQGYPALILYGKMQENGIKPEKSVFLNGLKACGIIGAMKQGQMIHGQAVRDNLEQDEAVGTALVEMYAGCGKVEEAHKIFHDLRSQNVVLWGPIITGYAKHGNYELVRQCLQEMQIKGLVLNDCIFCSVLSTCTQTGFLYEGHSYFKSMADHGIPPKMEHYCCMTDLLSRVGYFKVAEELLLTMPSLPDFPALMSILTGSSFHGNIDVGKRCFEELLQSDPNDASGFVQISKLCSDISSLHVSGSMLV